MSDPKRLELETEHGERTNVWLELEGERAGQLYICPDDDWYRDHTKMSRGQAAELVAWLSITHRLVDTDILPILERERYVVGPERDYDRQFLVLRETCPPYTISGAQLVRKSAGALEAWARTCMTGDVYEGDNKTIICFGLGRVTRAPETSGST